VVCYPMVSFTAMIATDCLNHAWLMLGSWLVRVSLMVGFLQVFSQRLEQDYYTQVLLTAPSVSYRVCKRSGDVINVESPAQFPATYEIDHCLEPMVLGTLVFPNEYMGPLLSLCEGHRGVQKVGSRRTDHFERLTHVLDVPWTCIAVIPCCYGRS
jgi:translation elongation factor EF-4